MTPHYVTSDGATYHCVQNYPGGLTVPVAEQPPPSDTVGIDPRFLVRGESGPPTQYDASEIALQFSGGSYYEAPAPGPSTSTSVWMGYQDNVVLATTAPPLIHMVGNMVSVHDNATVLRLFKKFSKGATYATSTGTCICGCGGSACIPQRPYEKQRTDLLTDDDLREMILFRRNGRCGYPLVDALGKRYTGLEKRDEKVFVGYKSSISIRLEVRSISKNFPAVALISTFQWLAYEKWTRQVCAESRVLHCVVIAYPSRSER